MRRMRPAIDGRIVLHKFTDAVKRFTRCGDILEHYGELVLMQRLVNVSDVAVEHIEQSVVFDNNDAVADGVSLSLDQINPVRNLLACREVMICAVGEADRYDVIKPLQLTGR